MPISSQDIIAMDLQAITATTPTLAQPLASAANAAPLLQDTAAPASTPAFEASFLTLSTQQARVTTGTQAEDLAAQAEQALKAQQTVLSALRSGASDVSVLLSGLPPGATATLLGGGWSRVPPGSTAEEAGTLWSFFFPLRREHVPAVTTSSRAAAARDKGQGSAKEDTALTFYGPHGEKETVASPSEAGSVDILD